MALQKKKRPTKKIISQAETDILQLWRMSHYEEYSTAAGEDATPMQILNSMDEAARGVVTPELMAFTIARIMAFESIRNESSRTNFIKTITQNDLIMCFHRSMPIPKQTLEDWDGLPVRQRRGYIESLPWKKYVSLYRRVMIDLSDIIEETEPEPERLDDEMLEEALDNVYDPFFRSPISPTTEAINSVLLSHGDLQRIQEQKKSINHSQAIEVLDVNGNRAIIFSKDVSSVAISLSDIEKLAGNNKAVKKMLAFTLIKINEQAYSNGTLKRNFIQYPLKELIENGLYSTPQSARVGFRSSGEILTSLKIRGTLKKGRKVITQDTLDVLFTGIDIKEGICTVFLNERVNWNLVAAFYTILPRYSFSLPARAYDLIYYIFYLARQHTKDIEEKGYFTISMKSIQSRLNLPDETARNAERDIRQAIENAIEAIEEAGKDRNFTITPVYTEGAPIAEYLNNGYLKIGLAGQYASPFKELATDQKKKITTAKKRKESIVQKAIAINMAKKMEQDEETAEKTEN